MWIYQNKYPFSLCFFFSFYFFRSFLLSCYSYRFCVKYKHKLISCYFTSNHSFSLLFVVAQSLKSYMCTFRKETSKNRPKKNKKQNWNDKFCGIFVYGDRITAWQCQLFICVCVPYCIPQWSRFADISEINCYLMNKSFKSSKKQRKKNEMKEWHEMPDNRGKSSIGNKREIF